MLAWNELIIRTVIGIIAVTEKVAAEAEREQTSMFFSQLFEKQLGRQRAMLDAFVVSPLLPVQSLANEIGRTNADYRWVQG